MDEPVEAILLVTVEADALQPLQPPKAVATPEPAVQPHVEVAVPESSQPLQPLQPLQPPTAVAAVAAVATPESSQRPTQPPAAVAEEELNKPVSGELVVRVPAPASTSSSRQAPTPPPREPAAARTRAPAHSASLCTNNRCAECSDLLGMIDSVDPTGQLADIAKSIETSRNESTFYSYIATGNIRALSKISLVKLFEALDGPTVPHRTILDAALGYLQDTYTSLIKGDIATLVTTANAVLEDFYKQPSTPITTEILTRVFPVLLVSSKRGEGHKSSTIIQRLADAARGSAVKAVFAKTVLMHLTRCVEQRLIFVGNLIIRMFDTINIMVDLVYPHYANKIREDYGVVTSVGGLTIDAFIVSNITAQLITHTQTFFEYVFDRKNDVEVQCTTDSVRILKSEELGQQLSSAFKTMKDTNNITPPSSSSSSSSTQTEAPKKKGWW